MFNIQEELKKLPDNPGVYIMKDENLDIIYIGKAVVLKNRVRQYFQSLAKQPPKVQAMVSRIKEFEYIVTDSELEALILECTLIKKHKPKYNILLKDDKDYPYIKVTMNEDYPRIIMTRRLEKDKAKYFGPYYNVGAVKETIDVLKKLFPIKTCNKVFPRDIGKTRPCLNFHIYQCMGPCKGDVSKEEYRSLMKDICNFLNGRHDEIVKRLEMQMQDAAEKMDFEKAAHLRDKLNNIKLLSQKQKVLSTAMEDQDVIGFAKGATDSCVQVFFIRTGKLIGREHFIIEDTVEVENSELMTSFVKQFYSTAAYVPGEIILQGEIDEINIIEKWLSDKREGKVHVKVPRKGEKLHLVEMVAQNALISLNQFKNRVINEGNTSNESLQKLSLLLELEEVPVRIEAYDISNTGSSEKVASLVVFENGRPSSKEYRRFKIKSVEGQNDYASMQEVIYRRFKHAEKEMNMIEEAGVESCIEGKFTRLPDLILIDGGRGHINSVYSVLNEMNINIPAFGMVKDDNHRTRGLVSPITEISLMNNLPVLKFVTAIQDEAHRFAVEYNRRLRSKRHTSSVLDEIDGVGGKRRKALIKHFKSVNKIKSAEIDELLKVEGINRAVAQKIYDYFH